MSRAMKDSGVPWLTDIPAAWNVERGKAILTLQKRPVREEDEVITCFRDGEVVLRSERRTEGFTMSDKEIGYQGINKGDIVIHGMDGFAGAMGVSKSTGKGSPVLVVCTPKYDAVPQFIIYYLRALAMTNVFVALATGIRERSCDLRWNKIAELDFILPPAAEQQAIADFLDKKCGEIDEMVSLQEKIVEELKAYKQSVITEAVCKGLNPDVPMKDSGIEWVDSIPRHWEEVRFYKVNYIRGRLGWKGLKAEEYTETGYPFLSAFNIINDKISWEDLNFINQERYDESPEIKLAIGDVLVVKDGAGIGKCARLDNLPLGEATVNSSLAVITPNERMFYAFQYYYMLSTPFQHIIWLLKIGMGVPHLTQENMHDILETCPPLEEQRAIADYLDKKCTEIDTLISVRQAKIDALKEFKKTIIYEYITGKKEING